MPLSNLRAHRQHTFITSFGIVARILLRHRKETGGCVRHPRAVGVCWPARGQSLFGKLRSLSFLSPLPVALHAPCHRQGRNDEPASVAGSVGGKKLTNSRRGRSWQCSACCASELSCASFCAALGHTHRRDLYSFASPCTRNERRIRWVYECKRAHRNLLTRASHCAHTAAASSARMLCTAFGSVMGPPGRSQT